MKDTDPGAGESHRRLIAALNESIFVSGPSEACIRDNLTIDAVNRLEGAK